MNRKNELIKVAAAMFTLLFSTVAGLTLSPAYGEEANSGSFTHSVFAEFGTATW